MWNSIEVTTHIFLSLLLQNTPLIIQQRIHPIHEIDSNWINSHKINSHRINSHRINSHRINSHTTNSHIINSKRAKSHMMNSQNQLTHNPLKCSEPCLTIDILKKINSQDQTINLASLRTKIIGLDHTRAVECKWYNSCMRHLHTISTQFSPSFSPNSPLVSSSNERFRLDRMIPVHFWVDLVWFLLNCFAYLTNPGSNLSNITKWLFVRSSFMLQKTDNFIIDNSCPCEFVSRRWDYSISSPTNLPFRHRFLRRRKVALFIYSSSQHLQQTWCCLFCCCWWCGCYILLMLAWCHLIPTTIY